MDILAGLFTLENLTILIILIALEAVLGFDNLLYVSLKAKKTGAQHEARVRRLGLILAIALRIVLLLVVLQLIAAFQEPFYTIEGIPFVEGQLSGHALIVMLGGIFLIYSAIREITNLLAIEDGSEAQTDNTIQSPFKVLLTICAMNTVFSIDTVLSAVALTDNLIIMIAAIIIAGVMMIYMAESVAEFLNRNRMYEVVGLFVLLLIGILLTTEGAELADLQFFGFTIEAMSDTTFYFVLTTIVLVEIVQGRYQKKLMAQKSARSRKTGRAI